MTSETEAIKTNEFLRRRKLRLQQVREQSKDIAKKIRQRAKVEKLRQVVDLDATKQKEYFECQDKLIKHLEILYARGVDNVGASHQSATELTQKDAITKSDISKLRGKEATAALRKQKQEKLDQQKKLLDRKLQARETANEISRDKSTTVAQKLFSKSTNTNKVSDDGQTVVSSTELANTKESNKDADKVNTEPESVKTSDMATQWDVETIPPEWEPAVPALSLPTDKDSSPREEDNEASKTDNKRLDLFALSKEMPSSLRGKYTHESRPRETTRPSLTLVSEYLQSRKLRLRENDTVNTKKKPLDDINNLKQTILHTRSSKPEGSNFNVCHVLDEQVIPVPSWRPEGSCQLCFHSTNYRTTPIPSRQFHNVTNSQINKIFSSIRPVPQPPLLPSPVLRGTSPFRRNKVSQKTSKGTTLFDKPKNSHDTGLNRKNSVMMYNHSTRDTRDLPCGDNKLVVRDMQSEEDAYSQAMKEESAVHGKDKEHQRKVQDMRNKVAVTKENVEKEYKDTMNFLNSLPKEKCGKVIKTAYMDDRRQQMQQESRQRKMQQEYKKIEKECKKHQFMNKNRNKSRSPPKQYLDDNFDTRDFQYSWMPVPESDSNLAIHAIPNTVKQKSGNSVKFSTVDSYHEYRSRHKHTPPTKDTQDKQPKKFVEAVIIDKDASESSDSSFMSTSDSSSVQNLILDEELKSKNAKDINKNLSDAERIIIYKVLDSRTDKKTKKQTKLLNEIAKSLSCIEQGQKPASETHSDLSKKPNSRSIKSSRKSAENAVSFEQLNEGVYKMVEEQGDNITSMYFTEHEKLADGISSDDKPQSCHCHLTKESLKEKNSLLHWESGDCLQSPRTFEVCNCGRVLKGKRKKPPPNPSTGPSTSSFITASNAKGSSSEQSRFIKLVDESGQEAGKFFIGSSGLLKDKAYEVVIQLRKKDDDKEDKPGNDEDELVQRNKSEDVINGKKDVKDPPTSSETDTSDTNNICNMQQPPEGLEVLGLRNVETPNVIPPKEIQNDVGKKVVSEEVMTDKNNHSRTNTESSEDICLIQSTSEIKEKRDQSVHTGFNHLPKSDMPARPATTTYTQTTLSSPVHRPVFFHMSSSTSTAYMSPPEMILPKYLRRNFGVPEDELYDVLYDPIETIEMSEKEYCEEYTGCTCTKCLLAKKFTLKQNAHVPLRKKMYDHKRMRTPPNTVRTPNDNNKEIHALNTKRVTNSCKTARLEKGKCKYNSGNSEPVKKHCRRNKRPAVENIPSVRNINTHFGLNLKPRNKIKTSSSNHDKLGRSKLNPIIKDYIIKLLALNRQGLKAVEVADQECSSVGTPGSSIINVPNNLDENKSLGNTISLEHIKNIIKRQIIEKHLANNMNHTTNPVVHNSSSKSLKNSLTRLSRKKPVHKVKSLNISKHLIKKNLLGDVTSRQPVYPSSTDDNFKPIDRPNVRPNRQPRSKSSPTPRQVYVPEPLSKFNDTESTTKNSTGTEKTDEYHNRSAMTVKSVSPPVHTNESEFKCAGTSKSKLRASSCATSPDSETTGDFRGYNNNTEIPVSMSTQTNQNIDSDSKFMKLAEDKLHNMEKIADLTEKCTKRLSNLAKVLEEVRKNKSLAYSQISSADSTDSQSDHKSDKTTFDFNNFPQILEIKSPEPILAKDHSIPKEKKQSEYMPVLTDIPKPVFKAPVDQEPRATSDNNLDSPLHLNANTSELTVKSRPKPPPALSRISLKHGQEYIIPHELSTVIEVDSPMSTKHKNQTSRNEAKDASNNSNKSSPGDKLIKTDRRSDSAAIDKDSSINPDLLESNANFSNKFKLSSTVSSDESKFQMIDLKQFNEIMLEPFISIQEYAKQYNMEPPDEGSNLEQREDAINDDMSSLHSDGSLPDVIAELLKRNIIAEPFKFDTASNINSTTISSESTLSMLALSKVRKDRKRSSVIYQNKESIAETSDTLSISSNPDLENAFKKLGMGWASSTLKKTKERLALSSSSNTSSSSIPHFKMKSFNQDIPALVTDSVSSALNSSKKGQQCQIDASKNAEQQTTLSNSMTVKEFLRNELSKKITFNNKSNINDTEEEFVSLFETKMPEELKENSQMNRAERSMDSAPSGTNRARTSTPVQIFKSMTYHSSSSSNISNGLFSNADDLSSVKITSNSIRNHSTSDKDDLTIPNFSLRLKKTSDCSKSD